MRPTSLRKATVRVQELAPLTAGKGRKAPRRCSAVQAANSPPSASARARPRPLANRHGLGDASGATLTQRSPGGVATDELETLAALHSTHVQLCVTRFLSRGACATLPGRRRRTEQIEASGRRKRPVVVGGGDKVAPGGAGGPEGGGGGRLGSSRAGRARHGDAYGADAGRVVQRYHGQQLSCT